MERGREIGWYQKAILVLMLLMVLVFAVLYYITVSKEGYAYSNVILVPNQENGSTVYSGEIQGIQAIFTVSADKTVEFRYGDKIYGPYTAKIDSTAVPKDSSLAAGMTGIEIRCGEEVFFRGGVKKIQNLLWVERENGNPDSIHVQVMGDGTILDADGNVVDPMEPSVSTILKLMEGPELMHKGDWEAWWVGTIFCVVIAISIVFADALFRFRLAFQVEDVDSIEPSDWEIASRYISWTVAPVLVLILFIKGLQ